MDSDPNIRNIRSTNIRNILGLVGVDPVAEVEIAVAHVADQEVGRAGRVALCHRDL